MTTADALNDSAVASCNVLERTLAVPNRPLIRDAEDLALADTLSPPRDEGTNAAAAASPSTETELREPIAGTHFQHNYVPDRENERELGRGGIGRVVLVFDHTLGREVAMKELLPELLADTTAETVSTAAALTQRFLREARITGQLEHPNIVPVYELGRQPAGCLYYTMRVVRGRTLASAIASASTTKERLTLVNHFAGLCQAIAYAHSRGVVHRDVKPENVMIGEFGETFVLDWGLANVIDDQSPCSLRAAATFSEPPPRHPTMALTPGTAESFHTQFGSIVGTPNYMSPEQLLMRSDGCSPTSDVWALGVVLYYLLTGRLPFSGNNFGELLLAATRAEVTTIAAETSDVPRDLAAIVGRALARDPKDRYPTAREMARDIVAYQTGEKVAAYDYSSLELLRRFANRNRAVLAVSTAALVALSALGVSSYRRIVAARDAAVAAEQRATNGEQRAKANLSDVLVERAKAEHAEGNVASATLLSAGAIELTERPDARGMLVALENADRLDPVMPPMVNERCRRVEWNPQLLELGCNEGQDFWSVSVRHPSRQPARFGPVSASFSLNAAGWLLVSESGATQRITPEGARHAVTAGFSTVDRSSASSSIAGYASAHSATADASSTSLANASIHAASPNGRVFATADSAGNVSLWPLAPTDPHRTYHAPYPITAISFSQNDALVAFGGYRGDIQTWNWQTEAEPKHLGNTHSTVRALAIAPKGNTLASGGSDGAVMLWDLAQRQLQLLSLRVTSDIVSLSYSPDGQQLACALRSGLVDVLDAKTQNRALRVVTGHSNLQHLTFATDDTLLGKASVNTALQYHMRRASPRAHYASRGNVLSLSWAKNQRDLCVAGLGEHGLCSLGLVDGICGDRLPLRVGLVRKVVHSPDRKSFIVAGTGSKVEIWDAERKVPRNYVDVPIAEVRDVAFLPDGIHVAIIGNSPMLVTLDIAAAKVSDRTSLAGAAQSLLVLPQPQLLAIGMRSGHVQFRSLSTGKVEFEPSLVSGWPIGLGFSERHGWLVVADDSGRITYFDLRARKRLESVTVGAGRSMAFAFSERLDLIAIAGEERVVHVLAAFPKPVLLADLADHQGTVRTLLFDDGNHRLFSSGDDGVIRLWSLSSLRTSATDLRLTAERQSGMRLEAGRIVKGTGG